MERPGERLELEAFRDLYAVAPADVGARLLESSIGAVAFRLPSLPDAREFNRIIGLVRAEELDELAPLYERGRFWVSLDPDAGLDDELAERGFTPDVSWQKFERDVAPLDAPTTLDVSRPRSAGDFGEALTAGYGVPPAIGAWADRLVDRSGWSCFVAYDGPQPVATGALFAVDRCGWVGMGATAPSHRGRGAQSAILAARIDRARELGLETLVTETGLPRLDGPGPSYRNIVRAGFRPTYVRPNYAAPDG